MKRQLEAYTLMEVLLTMIISSLVFIFVYTVFIFLDQQMFRYQKQTSAIQQYKLMEYVLKRDLYECEHVYITDKDVLELQHYDHSIISYKKEGQVLYRKNRGGTYSPIGNRLLSWDFEKIVKPSKEGVMLQMTMLIDADTTKLAFAKMKSQMQTTHIE